MLLISLLMLSSDVARVCADRGGLQYIQAQKMCKKIGLHFFKTRFFPSESCVL